MRVVADTWRMPWDRHAAAGMSLRIFYTDLDHANYVAMLRWGTCDRHHEHPTGEEIRVLTGTLADRHGVYRNVDT
ncbi:MAG: cupin domain-containing protein [Candidatus Binataceae bacterium]